MSTERELSRLETTLPEDDRRLHRTLIDAMLATGSVSSMPGLADRLRTTEEAILAGLARLAAADYLALDAAGQVTCLYPFSTTPTPHVVVVQEERRFAMCAIDALGIPAMLGRELTVEGRCAVCDLPIALRIPPGAVVGRSRRRRRWSWPAATKPSRRLPLAVRSPSSPADKSTRRRSRRALPAPTSCLSRKRLVMPKRSLAACSPRPCRPPDRVGGSGATPTMAEPVLYTQAGCAESAKVRSWLTERGIAFRERDAGGDQDAALELAATGTFATPLLVVGTRHVLGFQPNALLALLMSHAESEKGTAAETA